MKNILNKADIKFIYLIFMPSHSWIYFVCSLEQVMRLIRLVRLVKLYRHFESNKDPKNTLDAKRVENNERDVEESRVGQKLSGAYNHKNSFGLLLELN